ncbi:MAG: DUF3108 domain-containing protein [Rhodospirillales bacterium]|nr:DUF3108 domain-containing protein [Rhodospirillales bacterium]
MSPLVRPLVTLTLLFALGGASPATRDVSLSYVGYWGGLHMADTVVITSNREGVYRMRLGFQARGLTDVFFGLELSAESEGRQNPRLEPAAYRYQARSHDEETRVMVTFDPTTGQGRTVLAEKRDLPGGPWVPRDDEPLSAAMRSSVLDPLSAFAALGRQTQLAIAAGAREFTIAVFDGRRRYDLEAHVLRRPATDLPRIQVRVMPLAGFSQRHLERWRGRRFEITLDRHLWLPVRIEGSIAGVALVIRAVRTCPPAEGCVPR